MIRSMIFTALLALTTSAATLAQEPAQEKLPEPETTVVTKYICEAVSCGGQKKQLICACDTELERKKCVKDWYHQNPDDLRPLLYREEEYKVSRPRPNRPPPTPLPVLKPAERPGEARSKPGSLAGTTWKGSEDLKGFGKLEFLFGDFNTVTMIDAKTTAMGTWDRDGDWVIMRFYDGSCVYVGKFYGNQIAGFATADRFGTSFRFRVSR